MNYVAWASKPPYKFDRLGLDVNDARATASLANTRRIIFVSSTTCLKHLHLYRAKVHQHQTPCPSPQRDSTRLNPDRKLWRVWSSQSSVLVQATCRRTMNAHWKGPKQYLHPSTHPQAIWTSKKEDVYATLSPVSGPVLLMRSVCHTLAFRDINMIKVAKIDDLLRNQNRYETRSSDTDDEEGDMSSISDSLLSKGKNHPKSATGDILSRPPSWNATSRSSKFLRAFPNLESSLPSKLQCDVLLDAFIWNYHPIVPLVHIPSLKQENDAFWLPSNTKTKVDHLNTTYIPLLLAVWYAGSVVCSSEKYREAFPATTQLSVSTKLYKIACRGLRSINFPRTPTVESLTAYVWRCPAWSLLLLDQVL